jgi:hypothetical protein
MPTDLSTSGHRIVTAGPSLPRYEITLSREDFESLLLALGMATGLCFREGQEQLAYRIIQLTNIINAGNPDFLPYAIPPKYAAQHSTGHGEDDAAAESKVPSLPSDIGQTAERTVRGMSLDPSPRDCQLARQAFVLFWRQAWADHPDWVNIEPWERNAWALVAHFIRLSIASDLAAMQFVLPSEDDAATDSKGDS